MAMLHRNFLMTALLGLSLGACSFSYSSGSRSSSSPSHMSSGKPVHHSSGKVDNRGKTITHGTGSGKSMGKATPEPADPPPTRADNDEPPTRTPTADTPPQRTKVAPKRTKVPTREPVDDGTIESGTNQAPTASDDLKAKTKTDDPPTGGNPSASGNLKAKTKTTPPPSGNPSASGKLVAPH